MKLNKDFQVNRSAKFLVVLMKIVLWVVLPLLIYAFLNNALGLLFAFVPINDGAVGILGSSFSIYCAVAFLLQAINQYNNIRVTKDGLLISIYMFRTKWKLIQWEDILYVEKLSKLDRWGKCQWMVRVKSLSYWHKLIGWQYGIGLKPCIIINSDFDDQFELIKIIEKKMIAQYKSNK
jgi:hypothetical protein